MGRVPKETENGFASLIINSLLSQTCSITKLWDIDILDIRDPIETKSRKELETAALDYFQKTVTNNENGRYEFHLPWLETKDYLRQNKSVAERRCISTSMKLKAEGRYEDYDAVFKDWDDSKIIELVPEAEIGESSHYLPHRGVFKEHSTARVRPVFDDSSHEKGFPSLKDCLEKGPNLLEEIPPLLMRFRMDNIGAVSDIKKAFL
ncbi:uncharacterized protein [Parasteatoda tepidariorum]|uniref:uncharacterized protein n=1 Tax=Parasteatoda tepidariorum TaxID=114398 RepID=UPI001C727222|nr:uncharacterized protein LOC107445084 [Parasteatoda tepidariorum]